MQTDILNFRNTNIPANNDELFENAILSHYVHHINSYESEIYKKKALKIIDSYSKEKHLNFKSGELLEILIAQSKETLFKSSKKSTFTFIDLFAGIGGFRMALQQQGGKCVFSSEWDKEAQKTYFSNYGEFPFGDITKPEVKAFIPDKFDVLCAGFPCQPFSKGGFRNGFEDTRGTLFFDICEIVAQHQPSFIILENVSNLVTHDNGNTYQVILKNLDELGYYFPNKPLILSPDKFGVPILRPRVFIPCVRKDLAKENVSSIHNFNTIIEKHFTKEINSIDTILDSEIKDELSEYEAKVIQMWDDFYQGIDLKIIGFPIWSDYFKYEEDLTGLPLWKSKIIEKNTSLYKRNKKFIDQWYKKYDQLDWCVKTHKKMEWQAGESCESAYECLIQFRPSGVRIKRPDKFSTLVAMNHRQIIGKYKRKIAIDEAKLLQSFPAEYQLSKNPAIAMKQLGNSVNVTVIGTIFSVLKQQFDVRDFKK